MYKTLQVGKAGVRMADFGPVITPAELAESLGAPDLTIIDCRFSLANPAAGRSEWLQAHIPSAVFVDLEEDLSLPVSGTTGRHPLPGIEKLGAVFARAGVGSDSRVVVYDSNHGGIAARAWWTLKLLGHEQVALLEGGFQGWGAAGGDTEQGEHRVEPGNLKASTQARQVVTTEDVLTHLADPERLRLVDAREPARFRGEQEPIDHTAGRVPGARNLPFTELVDAANRFLDPALLAEKFTAVLGNDTSRAWTAMCGSGVTACHLAIAAELAGYIQPAIYIGSFSEWIQDPDRPVELG